MADRRVKVIVEAEVSRYAAAMKAAGKSTEDLAKSTDQAAKSTESLGKSGGAVDGLKGRFSQLADESSKVGKAAQDITPALATIGGIGAAGLLKAVSTAASFDKAMSGVQAATLETEDNMRLLSDAAIRAGADTAYSAEEAAGAIEELAKAGVSTADILAGGLDGALSLAAAGELDVARAAEIAASAMTQFGLSGSEIPHIADLLAAGAGKAQGSVEDMGQALNQVGLVADQTGLTIEETTGGLAAFASAGMTGSDAGTSFKSMLQRLTPQSEAAARTMEELGLSAYDSSGEFIGLSEYAGLLQESLKGMSSEQRNAALQTLFGADAIRAASVLYEQGAEGVEQWEQAVNEAGYASETAAALQNNLAGDLEKLGGAFDTVFLQAGTGANDVLRDLVQGAEGLVDAVGQLPAPVLQAGAAVSGLVGAAGLGAAGFITIVPKIKETKDALEVLAPVGTRAGKAVGALGKTARVAAGVAGIGLLTVGVAKLATEMGPAAATVEEMTNALLGLNEASDISALNEQLSLSMGMAGEIENIAEALALMDVNNPARHLASFLDDMAGAGGNLTVLREEFDALDQALAGMDLEAAGQAMNRLRLEAEAGGRTDFSNWTSLSEKMPAYAAAVEAAANATGRATTDADLFQAAMGNLPPHMRATADSAAVVEEAMGGIAGSADEAEESLEDIIKSLQTLGVMNRDAEAAADSHQQALRDLAASIKDNGAVLEGNTEKAAANRAAMREVAETAWSSAEAYAAQGAAQGQVQGALESGYNSLVKNGQAMGKNKAEAELYARSLMGIPDDVSVETWMDDTAAQMAEFTGQAVETIPGYKAVTIAVSEDGTTGSVQAKINKVSGKTEYIFVDTDGTHVKVQQQIRNIEGVDRTVWVDDEGTIYSTQRDIKAITGKEVPITAKAYTADAEASIAHLIRGRAVSIAATIKTFGQAAFSTGGVVGSLPSFSTGGVLPRYGKGTDTILGIGSSGMPTAWVDDGEWVVRRTSSQKYNRLLGLVNADHPSVQHLAGHAGGGPAGREWSAGPTMAPPRVNVQGHTMNVEPIDYDKLAAAMSRVSVQMDGRATIGQLAMVNRR